MAHSRITGHSVDNRMAQVRNREAQFEEILKFTADNRKLAHSAQAEIDIPNRRRAERTAQFLAEEQMQKLIDEGERKARIDERTVAQNVALAGELEKRRAERTRKEREIQRICDESEELKELERRLKIAYMSKERAAQHEEKIVLTRIEREQNQAMEDAMEVDRQFMIAAEMEKEKARRMVGLEQKSVLQIQIREREAMLEEAKLEALRDKAMVEEVVRKIEAEDSKEFAIREMRKDETRAIIKQYERQRVAEVAEKKRREAEAEAEIKRHLDAVAARNDGVQEAKANKAAAEAARFAAIAEEAERARLEEEELNRLRDILWAEELEAARRREDQAKAEAKATAKAEMAFANQQMLAAKSRQREAEAREEARLVALMMAKFAKDEADERAGEERRKQNKDTYKREIVEQKALRRELYEKERNAELESVAHVKEDEDYKKAVVAEARRRLLEEHAKRLHGFLPKGSLANQEEYSILQDATFGYQ